MKHKVKSIKVTCRKLPPRLTNQQFVDQFRKWIDKSVFTYFVSGDHKDPMKRTYSTAYLTFTSDTDYKDFLAECNGHTFLEEKGATYKLQIEPALYSKVTSKKQKLPEGCDTYTETEDYKQFVEMVGKEVEKLVSVDQLEEEKVIPQVAPLVANLNEYSATKGGYREKRRHKGPRAQKEEVKYVIKKRLQEPPKEEPQATKEEPIQKQRPKVYYGGKNGGIIYRKKQTKEETK